MKSQRQASPQPQLDGHPGLRPDSRLTPDLIERYERSDAWEERTLHDLLDRARVEVPTRVAAAEFDAGGKQMGSVDYATLHALAGRYAAGLEALGVGQGDVVTVMLPNCIDFAALIFAISKLGAVYTGIPVGYGRREVEVILRRTRASVCIAQDQFGSATPSALLRDVLAHLPEPPRIVVRGSADGDLPLTTLLEHGVLDVDRGDPRAVCHIGFTSGTTGEPKGVMNTHQTLRHILTAWERHVDDYADRSFVNLVASPVGHHTGFVWGLLMTTYVQGTGVYLERWKPQVAADLVASESVTDLFVAPTFLFDLLALQVDDRQWESLELIVVTGAPVPRDMPEIGSRTFGCTVLRAWGMTELGIGISCAPGMAAEAFRTEGVPIGALQARIVGEQGEVLGAGELGRLEVTGPGLFLGYLDRVDAMRDSFSPDGWFDTGDTATIDHEGYVTLQGRLKDVIIRGGENVPVADVESLLFAHPDIAEAAVVGVPDERLGERALAVVVPQHGVTPTLATLCRYLLAQGISKHFLPERLEVVTALPKNASGKVLKAQLRKRYA